MSAEHCERLLDISWLNFGFSAFWLGFGGYWLVNTWWLHQRNSNALHKALFSMLVLRALCDLLTGLLFTTCPFTSSVVMYLTLAVNTSFTLSCTLQYSCLLLIAKGFGISRNTLERREISELVTALVVIYLGFSAYNLQPAVLGPLALALLCALFCLTLIYTVKTLRRVELQIASYRQHDIPQMIVPTALKWQVIHSFYYLTIPFFLVKIAHMTASEVIVKWFPDAMFEWYFWGDLVGGGVEAVILGAILALVRARELSRYSSLDYSHDHVFFPMVKGLLGPKASKRIPPKTPVIVVLGPLVGLYGGVEIGYPEH